MLHPADLRHLHDEGQYTVADGVDTSLIDARGCQGLGEVLLGDGHGRNMDSSSTNSLP